MNTQLLQYKIGQAIIAVSQAKREIDKLPKPESLTDYSITQAWQNISKAETLLIVAENQALAADDE